MKLIIDIPEEVYNYIMRLEMRNMGEEYIKNGMPLDKIRAEIEQLPTEKCTETRRIYIDVYDFKEKVLEIIDKHIGGKE